MQQTPFEIALTARNAGLSVVPPREDGSKAPLGAWGEYQRRRADEAEIREWYRNGRQGVGLVCGSVSGNLELFEFDDMATYQDYKQAAKSIGLGPLVERIERGYCEQTPGDGVHWLYRSTAKVESEKLATRPGAGKKLDCLIETKGEGGYVVIAPSQGKTHASGKAYILLSGSVSTIADISSSERDLLRELARSYTVMPQQEIVLARRGPSVEYSAASPGNDYCQRADWQDILGPHGWVAVRWAGDVTLWRRPGKREGASATTNYAGSNLFYPFTTSTEFDAYRGYNKFSVYTMLNHNGDFHAAAAALRQNGYGHDEKYPTLKLLPSPRVDEETGEIVDEGPAQSEGRYTLHHVREAFQLQPPIEWIVAELFCRGSVSIIVGPPGSKKTYTTLDCAICVALGEYWLDRETVQGPVLLIDEESGIRRLNRRLHELMEGHKAGPDSPIWYTSLEMWNMREHGDVTTIDSLMCTLNPVLVVIDALADVMPGGDENAVKDTHPVFMNLRGLAEKHRAAIVVIHHANKAGGYRGSTAIEGAVDLMLMVESKDNDMNITYSTVKSRDTEPQVFGASIKFSDEVVELAPLKGVITIAQKNQAEAYVVRYLSETGSAALADILDHADSCTAGGARHAVYSLVERGALRRIDGGGRGKSAIYELVING